MGKPFCLLPSSHIYPPLYTIAHTLIFVLFLMIPAICINILWKLTNQYNHPLSFFIYLFIFFFFFCLYILLALLSCVSIIVLLRFSSSSFVLPFLSFLLVLLKYFCYNGLLCRKGFPFYLPSSYRSQDSHKIVVGYHQRIPLPTSLKSRKGNLLISPIRSPFLHNFCLIFTPNPYVKE